MSTEPAVRPSPLPFPPRLGSGGRRDHPMVRLIRDPIGFMTMAAEFGPLVRWRLGPRELFFANHPDLVGEILSVRSSEFVMAGSYRDRIHPFLGSTGLALLDGPPHMRARRLMNPLFTRKQVAGFAGIIVDTINEKLETWDGKAGEPFDLGEEMTALTMNVLLAAVFSSSIPPGERTSVTRDFAVGNAWMTWRILTDGLPEWVPGPYHRKGGASAQRLHEMVRRLITARRADPERHDLLSLLLSARFDDDTPLSDLEIQDHVMNFLFAGHDTTAVSLTWTLALLARHPDWQREARAEIEQVIGDREPTSEDWRDLKVLRACWDEAMRLYPPGFMVGRVADADCDLAGFRVPAGSPVIANLVAVHRHPDFWADGDRYDPGRFLDGAAEGRHRWAYMPFGVGPKTCIGGAMATMDALLFLALALRRFQYSVLRDPKPKIGVVLRVDGPDICVRRQV